MASECLTSHNQNVQKIPKRKQNRKKTASFTLWMEESEKQIWMEKMKEKNMTSLAQFVRSCVDFVIYQQNTSINPTNQSVLDDFNELQLAYKSLDKKLNIDLPSMLNQVTGINRENDIRTVEEKIISHLTGRRLYLNQLSNYCQEPPGIVLNTLSNMPKAKQDSSMRWELI
jgi:hypothetical protein